MSGAGRPGAVLLAGGGSGGHIFPALAIAEQIIERSDGKPPAFVFAISEKPLDAELLRDATLAGGSPRAEPIEARPFSLRPGGLLRFLASWRASVKHARSLIGDLKKDHGSVSVIATGGYVSAPVLRAARAERCKATLVSLDAVPGKAGRFAARWADRVFTAEGAAPKKWRRIRPVVRAAAIGDDQVICREALGFDPAKPVLFVSGGSQGARSINRLILRILEDHPDWLTERGWSVAHQSGADDGKELFEAYKKAGVHAIIRPVFNEVGLCWGAAEIAIGRAGAGTVGEAWANTVPALFLPYPYHTDDHQKLNAKPLTEAGACTLLEDRIEPAKNLETHGDALEWWLKGDAASEKAARFGQLPAADGAETIARAVLA